MSWFKERFVNNKADPTEAERKEGIKKLSNMMLGSAYITYVDWCKETNKQNLSRPNFEEEMKNQFGIVWRDES